MKRPRYAVVLPSTVDAAVAWYARVVDRLRNAAGLTLLHRADDLIVLGDDVALRPFLDGRAVVLGDIYMRSGLGAPHVPTLDREVRDAGLAALASNYWGDFVAVAVERDGRAAEVMRSPWGDLPCLVTRQSDALVFASDLPTLTRLAGVAPTPDWTGLARFLLAEDVLRPRGCVAGVDDLLAGTKLELRAGCAVMQAIWSPWDHVAADDGIDADDLREAVVAAVGTAARRWGKPLLRLSGGLDSSIVAAALGANAIDFSAMTMTTTSASGDERAFARAVARKVSVPLAECARDTGLIDVARSEAAGQVRPAARLFSQASGQLSAGIAAQTGASVVFDGGGGDQLFCSLRSARILVDAWRSRRSIRSIAATAVDLSRLTRTSLTKVGGRALRIARRASPNFTYPADARFLAAKWREEAEMATTHAWLCPPAGALPGKAAQIAMLVQAQTVLHAADADGMPLISPLLSQPLVERCLAVPTWTWIAGARDRALARTAFAPLLPPVVIERPTKGTPDGFLFAILRDHRRQITTMLLDGMLAHAGLLDVPSLADALREDYPMRAEDCYRILRLVDAEAWARAL